MYAVCYRTENKLFKYQLYRNDHRIFELIGDPAETTDITKSMDKAIRDRIYSEARTHLGIESPDCTQER